MHYLIMEDFSGKPAVFIFPRRVDHADMREQLPYSAVLSAGLVELTHGAVRCFGGHAELALKARSEDAAIIAETLGPR